MSFNLYYFFGKKKSSLESVKHNSITISDDKKELIQELNSTEFNITQIEQFLHLTEEDSVIREFLEFDTCYKLADKYLLSIVFVYFIRAKLRLSEYNRANFFSALCLAHDVEEDDESYKRQVIYWGLCQSRVSKKRLFLKERDRIWLRMGYRALVNIQCCLQVMNSKPDSPLWQRDRNFTSVTCTPSLECTNCKDNELTFYHTDSESEDSSEVEDSSKCSQDSYSPPAKRMRVIES